MSESTDDRRMVVVVGRIGRAHGLRGEVAVEVRTDSPDERFEPGSELATSADGSSPLTVADARWHSGRLLVAFDGIDDRTAAEGLRGLLLHAQVNPADRPADPDEYYDRHLVGLRVVGLDGAELGTVTEVLHLPGHDLLAVARPHPGDGVEPSDSEVLVPFVSEVVVDVDLTAGFVRVDPPGGLFDDEPSAQPR